jgi:hypothetical protein
MTEHLSKSPSQVLTNESLAQAVQEKRTALKCVLILASFFILTVWYYFNFHGFPRSSDDANVFLSGYDMSQGNWRLQGWWLTDDNFWTMEVPLYAILVKCLGLNPRIIFYLPAFLWAGLALFSVFLAQAGLVGRNKASAVAAVATPILLPVIRDNAGMDQITHAPNHIVTIIYVLACFFLARKVMSRHAVHSTLFLVAYVLLMCLAVVGDAFAIFIGAIPVCMVAMFSILQGQNRLPHWLILAFTILAVVVAKVLIVVNSHSGGFEIVIPQDMRFVPFSELGRNLGLTLQSFFVLFGCDFFGRDVFASPIKGPALPLLRLPLLALLIVALVQVGRKFLATAQAKDKQWPVAEGDQMQALLAAGFVTCVFSGALSTRLVNLTTVRYFIPALVFGAILIARTPAGGRLRDLSLYFALAASVVFSALGFARNERHGVLVAPNIADLSSWLSNNDLRQGFGPYWSSSIVTATTGEQVKIRALISDSQGKLKPFQWEASKAWYRPGAMGGTRPVFVLVDKTNTNFYTQADVIRTLGEPRARHEVGSYIINVYDPDNEQLRSLSLASATAR